MQLSDFDHLRAENKVRFIEEIVAGKKYTTVCYMIADNSFWELPMSHECRGSVFDESGKCVSRAFPKFFNLNENKFVQQSDLDFTDAIFFNKKDGSMIQSLVVDHKVYLKTKKSFYSDVAIDAQKNLDDQTKTFTIWLSNYNLSPIYEYTSPDNKVVINYGDKPTFTLLAVIDNETGKYISHEMICDLIKNFPYGELDIPIIETYDITIEEALAQREYLEGIEGWVCLLKDGTRVKIKTEWYRRNHHLQTDLTYRDIAEMVANETLDDMKAEIAAEGINLDIVLQIEKEVTEAILTIADNVEKLCTITDGWTDKETALMYSKHFLFSLLMKLRKKKEPEYGQFWKKQFLKNYSTRSIYNKNF